jgi:Alcohol dehydrogenase GroES-like domain
VSDRTYRSVRVAEPGAPLTSVDVPVREPGPGQVRVAVRACGVCHTDSNFVTGSQPGLTFPVTPGHEVAGVIEALGKDVHPWRVGERVAIGWSGGYCGYCSPCRRGDFVHCAQQWVTGAAYPGGYAERMIAPQTALARIPDELSAADAARSGHSSTSASFQGRMVTCAVSVRRPLMTSFPLGHPRRDLGPRDEPEPGQDILHVAPAVRSEITNAVAICLLVSPRATSCVESGASEQGMSSATVPLGSHRFRGLRRQHRITVGRT